MISIFSQNYLLYIKPKACMAKLSDRKKLQWCLKQFEQGKATQTWLANYLGVTLRRFKQIYRIYKKTKTVPKIGLHVGRPKAKISNHQECLVTNQWNKHQLNALYLETIIDLEQKQRIPHNSILFR